ncbi:MAG: hypothetical protein RLZZ350_1702 [Verrucomicrobiota bacterium]|jgi:glycosyltransferase involved in cell wall biosynthesis
MPSLITPLILTFNEAPNLARTLAQLAWAERIIVVDSFSTDDTLAICKNLPQVAVVQRRFDTFAGQCNFGLTQINSPWVLSLDADYVLTDELVAELRALAAADDVAGFSARFTYCVHGRPLRASLYPPRTVLYRANAARYADDGHGHRVQISGKISSLAGKILHDDRKPLDRWLGEQLKYSAKEAVHLTSTPVAQLNRADRIRRKIILAPPLVLLFTLFGKGLIFDGWPGWFYALQRTFAEVLLSLRLLEQRLKTSSNDVRTD